MSTLSAQISSLIDVRFENFKTQFSQEYSVLVEAAVKRSRRDRYVFQSKGNEQQFEHTESVLEKLETAKNAVNSNAIAKAKSAIEEGIALVTKRMKVIKIADKSEYSWATVQEYLTDELVSNSETRKGFSAVRRELRGRSRSQRKSVFGGLIEDFSHIRLLIVVIPQIGELALAVPVSVLRVVSQLPARLVHVLR